ncbi:hypothetical protein ACOI22_08780 [Glaciecola sp. 2405UD65-10]|uniref:hypothetical protein n=1 Tax=Glaciecola sp. 2405UD65-10 TaxID=3397244 RepID=UPI003B5B2FE0
MDWQSLIFDPKTNFLQSMDNIAAKRFFDAELARTAVDECLDLMRQDNWAKLNAYEGRNSASAKTFFFIVYRRCLEDYYRKVFGRCEPPAWTKQLGEFWVRLYKQLCCQGASVTTLINAYKECFSSDYVQKSISTIRQKDPKCHTRGKQIVAKSIEVNEQSDSTIDSSNIEVSSTNDADTLHATIFEQSLNAIHLWLGENLPESHDATQLLNKLNELELDIESKLLLRLVYQEGLKIPAAAAFIQIEAYTARRRIKDALAAIKTCFKDSPLDY